METSAVTIDNTPAQSEGVSIRCAVESLSLPLPLPPPLKPGGGISFTGAHACTALDAGSPPPLSKPAEPPLLTHGVS